MTSRKKIWLAGASLTALAVGGDKRLAGYPDIPTIAESVPGFDVTPWVGVFVPARTDRCKKPPQLL